MGNKLHLLPTSWLGLAWLTIVYLAALCLVILFYDLAEARYKKSEWVGVPAISIEIDECSYSERYVEVFYSYSYEGVSYVNSLVGLDGLRCLDRKSPRRINGIKNIALKGGGTIFVNPQNPSESYLNDDPSKFWLSLALMLFFLVHPVFLIALLIVKKRSYFYY